ncbi:hypothetical protein SAMN05216522_107180 [Rosenbergiella nectarea]|uniref:DUF4435 domain-containing protein n=1 Tax=Rosenbergiella nectarea TaxID=988801 RepID=A0A1H9JHV5_9GAMM|nr:DUF4435 domain-containing protein [Rosenbergiella nectarea]SEQ86135.1 hypothetical protein SAMN05216522_107180 [Rosenbergiella nectarea]
MNNFSDYFKKEEFVGTYSNMYSGEHTGAGLLYIEDSSDRCFWESVVDAVCPGLYRVMKYSQNGSDGKRLLEKEYDNLHKKFIVGVDGDYDYLCPDRNEYSLKLNENPFVLHTHSYAVENLKGCQEAIRNYSNIFRLHEQTHNSLAEALEAYSNFIYEALCIFSYLHNKSPDTTIESEFNSALFSNNQNIPISNNLSINNNFIDEIKGKTQDYVNRNISAITNIAEFEQYKITLHNKGLQPNSAYLFVEAHTFYDSMLIPSIKKIRYKSKCNDIQHVHENYKEEVITNKIKNICNHYENRLNIETIVYQCKSYKHSFAWSKIIKKLTDIVK